MKTETWHVRIKNRAEQVWRFQNWLYFKHRQQLRRARRWLGKAHGLFWLLFIGFALVITALDNLHQDALSAWFESAASASWVGWLFMIVMVVVTLAIVVCLMWRIPRFIVTHKEVKKELRREVLRKALKPVPSRSEIAWRFGTVLVVVWLGLRLFETLFYWLGYCLLDVNDACEHTVVADFIWLIFAVGLGIISIWNMAEAWNQREIARRRLVNLDKPVSRRIRDMIKLLLTGIIGTVLLVIIIFGISVFLDL